MKLISKKRWFSAVSVAVVSVILSWPVGGWLQQRDRWLKQDCIPDAVYLVAGGYDQNRRIEAVSNLLMRAGMLTGRILIGNDRGMGRWSEKDDRCLSRTEWAVRKLEPAVQACSNRQANVTMIVVPGSFTGTDGEMEALADYLAERPDIHSVALVTTSYHVRRALLRLEKHLHHELQVAVFPAEPELPDRAPWLSASEIFKMLRDLAGLSRCRWLSRREP